MENYPKLLQGYWESAFTNLFFPIYYFLSHFLIACKAYCKNCLPILNIKKGQKSKSRARAIIEQRARKPNCNYRKYEDLVIILSTKSNYRTSSWTLASKPLCVYRWGLSPQCAVKNLWRPSPSSKGVVAIFTVHRQAHLFTAPLCQDDMASPPLFLQISNPSFIAPYSSLGSKEENNHLLQHSFFIEVISYY